MSRDYPIYLISVVLGQYLSGTIGYLSSAAQILPSQKTTMLLAQAEITVAVVTLQGYHRYSLLTIRIEHRVESLGRAEIIN